MFINIKKKRRGNLNKSTILGVDNFEITMRGNFLKIATIKDEFWKVENLKDPELIINYLKKNKPKPDIFAFTQKITNPEPRFNYTYEWDNIAAIPITNYENWYRYQINGTTRKTIRVAEKKGVKLKQVDFNHELVNGIMNIYHETPIRQAKRFTHYDDDFDTVKRDNSTFYERAEYIGAYCNNELIGFVKIVYIGNVANMMQILSKINDRDKNTNNALIAKTVEVCAQKKVSFLTYGNYTYGKKGGDSLTEFKKHNGFKKIDIPRYYIPLTLKGKIALKFGFHHFPYNIIPLWLLNFLFIYRSKFIGISQSRPANFTQKKET